MTQPSPIYVCVTNLLESRHQKKTGIPRVEYEVAKYLVARGALAVTWNSRRGRFDHVDFAAVIESMARAQSLDLDTICDRPQHTRPLVSVLRLQALAAAGLARHLPMASEPGRAIALFAFRRIVTAWPHLSPQQRRAITARLRLTQEADRLGHFIDVLVEARDGARRTDVPRGRVDFGRDATLLLLGIWWNNRPLEEIARLKRTHGLRFIGLVHDLLPIRRPEFFTDDVGRGRFTRFVDALIDTADTICGTSLHVCRDVEAYARERGVAIRPVVPIALCSELSRVTVPALTPALAGHGLEPGRFVVFVSTINPRKNHLWAHRLWRRLVDEIGDPVPTLVFAGQRGWRYEELLRTMSADPLMWKRKLRFIEGPSDEEIAWLYANCAFTIFPSLFEGWGLPIIESLSFGKYCLAADNTSLPEASQGLAFHAAPGNETAWLAEIRRVIAEPGYLDTVNARIRERFVARGWDDVGAEMTALIETVRRTPWRAPT